MEAKKIIGVVLTILGAIGLAAGVLTIFQGGEALGKNSYAMTILGIVFFVAGIGLMKSVKSGSSEGTGE